MSTVVVMVPDERRKLRPRGRSFRKGERHPFQFKPGQSGNPGGKPKIHQTLTMEYERWLAKPAAADLLAAAGLPPGSTHAEAIAAAMCTHAAQGDVSAAREICERTEGRVPAATSTESKIDYSAGLNAKEYLLKKLGVKSPATVRRPLRARLT